MVAMSRAPIRRRKAGHVSFLFLIEEVARQINRALSFFGFDVFRYMVKEQVTCFERCVSLAFFTLACECVDAGVVELLELR
jgi:hypothetical protein